MSGRRTVVNKKIRATCDFASRLDGYWTLEAHEVSQGQHGEGVSRPVRTLLCSLLPEPSHSGCCSHLYEEPKSTFLTPSPWPKGEGCHAYS